MNSHGKYGSSNDDGGYGHGYEMVPMGGPEPGFAPPPASQKTPLVTAPQDSSSFLGGMLRRFSLFDFVMLALVASVLGMSVVALERTSGSGLQGPIGPPGPAGATGPPGPTGPSGAASLNATNGLTLRLDSADADADAEETETTTVTATAYLGGTLVEDTYIDQEENEMHFVYRARTHMDMGHLTFSPNTEGGAFGSKWADSVALAGALLLDDGSKRSAQTMIDWALETPLTYYQQFAELDDRKRELHKRAVVGVQGVIVHGNAALNDLSLSIAQSFGAGLLNLDPANNNAQIVATDYGISVVTQQTHIELIPGSGNLYIRNLAEDSGSVADQLLVRDSGSDQVMWASLAGFIGVENGLHLDGSDIKLGGSLIEDTYIDQDSHLYTHTFNAHDTLVIGSSVTVSPDNGELYTPGLDEDPNNSDQNLVRYSGNGQVAWVERSPTTVYTNDPDPNSATIFSYNYPPTFNNPFADENPRFYYVGSDGSVWYYDSGSNTYLSFGFGFVATPEMAGSSCQVYSSVKQDIDNTNEHEFDQLMLMWGPSVFCTRTSAIIRNGGIYEVVVEEYLAEASSNSVAEYGIYADGNLVGGSSGYMSNDFVGNGITSKAARAIIKADGPLTITVKTVNYVGSPVIGPNSSFSVKQIYWFSS